MAQDKFVYHEPISENLDSCVAKRGSSEFEIAEMATEDLSGHGDDVVEQIHNDGRACQAKEGVEFDESGLSEPVEV